MESNGLDHLEMLKMLEKEDLIKNFEVFECKICYNLIRSGKGVTLKNCLHNFCKDCLSNWINYTDSPEIICPFINESYSCSSLIQEREIRALLPPDLFERYLAKSIRLAERKDVKAFHCKNPLGCPGWGLIDDDIPAFYCPCCYQRNCLKCQAIHGIMECDRFQREATDTLANAERTQQMMAQMIENGEALQCPSCSTLLVKNAGCDYIRCVYCLLDICWVTKGPRWGPGGKGDESGGCRCGVNGVKCSPDCRYCH